MEDKQAELFDSLASLSVPLERAFHLSLELIKLDKDIKDNRREELLSNTKALLFNSLELHHYLRQKNPKLDFCLEGQNRYIELRNDFQKCFPSFIDRDFNLHEMIDKETDRRLDESLRSGNPNKRT